MKAIISIPIHERPDVVLDQIRNINHYFPEAEFVLHINKAFFEKYNTSTLEGIPGVYLNTTHLQTEWGNLLPPHLTNIDYLEDNNIQYDYLVFHSSNDLYVRTGASDYIQKYDAGFFLHYLPQKYTYWWPCEKIYEDTDLDVCMSYMGQTRHVVSQIEGSFYKHKIVRQIMNCIHKALENGKFDMSSGGVSRAREEAFFPTLAECLIPNERIGRPFVFSEVHRFDRKLWSDFQRADSQYSRWGHYLLPKRVYNKLKSYYNDFRFKQGAYETTPEIVDKIRRLDEKYVEENRFLDDGVSKFELYHNAASLFAVKRVKREYDDPLRKYIRDLLKQEQS